MAKEKVVADVRDSIMEKMDAEGRALSWLADVTQINYNTLYSCLKRKQFTISEENLKAINTALGTNFKID